MDEHGYFNFGPSASHLGAVCEKARKIIVEVNKNMPRCLGGTENWVHISQVAGVVEGDNPPIGQMAAPGAATEVDLKVANLIVPQIPNGACLQLGIGGMPNAIGNLIAQSDLKDLGVHTEMYVDAFVDIAKAGKITGRHKNLDKGRQVYAFGAGTQKMYDYLDNNPECMAAPVEYTNDIRSISAIDNFISINNAVDIDLFGQVNAESAGIKHISGAGGQLDFVLGAYLSNGGKSFICLSSTFMNKKDRQGGKPHPPHAGDRQHRHRYPCQHPLSVYRVRLREPEGSDQLGKGRSSDQRRPPRFPGGADRRGREDAHLAQEQQTIKCAAGNSCCPRQEWSLFA